jgi:hypothetical protein
MGIFNTNAFQALLLAAGLLSACESKKPAASANEASTAPTAADTMCYQQVVGRDSTLLRLVVRDSLVTGFLAIRPAEKDRAEGTLTGTRSGDTITADWQRQGEGQTQTHALTFTMTGDSVRWREGERVRQGGKWTLKNPAAGYEYRLTKTDCR